MLKLEPHQQKFIDENPKKAILNWETRTGKSLPSSVWIDMPCRAGNTYIICLKQNKKEWQRYNTKATVLTKEEFKKAVQENRIIKPTAMVVDECFVAGTKVLTPDGYKNIENINIGDKVINAVGTGIVKNIGKKESKKILKIKLSDKTEINVTEKHPIFTDKGWIKASELDLNSVILHYSTIHEIIDIYENNKMYNMSEKNDCKKKRLAKNKLFKKLYNKIYMEKEQREDDFKYEEKLRNKYNKEIKNFKSNEDKQSYDESGNKKENYCYVKKNRTQTKNTWWKWSRDANTTTGFIISSWKRLVCRTYGFNKNKWNKKRWISKLLQNRYSTPKKNDSHRSRWFISFNEKKTRARQEKNIILKSIRVESIEIQESGSDDRFMVYNLEVSGHPSYIVNNILVHNCHYFASPLFLRKRSQLSEALYKIVKDNPDMDFLGLSGTIIRQDAWSLHTILCYIGVYYDWKKWRETFFELKTAPFLKFPAWFPKKNWREEIKPIKEKHCNILGLKDIVNYLPPIKDEIVNIKNKIPKQERWTDTHKLEQNGKIEYISQLGYNKVIVVAHYTSQIDEMKEELSKYKNVYVLDGRTKDADEVKRQAQEDDDCYFIVQASMGFGFDGYMFGALVFASMSHSCVHHTQMIGRLRHLSHLRPLTHIYLIGGIWDSRIFRTVKSGQDFNPNDYKD